MEICIATQEKVVYSLNYIPCHIASYSDTSFSDTNCYSPVKSRLKYIIVYQANRRAFETKPLTKILQR